MIEIEKFPCKDGNEARARERYWYEELKATLTDQQRKVLDDILDIPMTKKDWAKIDPILLKEYYDKVRARISTMSKKPGSEKKQTP